MLAELGANKVFIGIAMIIMNLGSRYIITDLTPEHEKILKSSLFKKIIMFCIIFIATRDIMTAIILTFAFFTIMNGFLNKKSGFYIFGLAKATQFIY